MRHRLVVVAAGVVACSVYALARQDASIPFPTDYRKWTHVKSTLVGPDSPAFARNGGYHHFYANAAAMEGYRTGTFADGSILIDDGLEAVTNGGVVTEGPRRRVAVMLKDSARFRDSQGWGFEVFLRDDRKGSLTAEARAACLACHQKAERNLVFSKFRE
jgi:hypothetical protein